MGEKCTSGNISSENINLLFSSMQRCHEHADKFLKHKNGEGQHTIHAMGHCHIDTGMEYTSTS